MYQLWYLVSAPSDAEEQQIAAQVLIKPEEAVEPLPEDDADPASVSDNADEIRTTELYSQLLQQKLKRQKREVASEQQDVYLNLDMLPGTSVNCERYSATQSSF